MFCESAGPRLWRSPAAALLWFGRRLRSTQCVSSIRLLWLTLRAQPRSVEVRGGRLPSGGGRNADANLAKPPSSCACARASLPRTAMGFLPSPNHGVGFQPTCGFEPRMNLPMRRTNPTNGRTAVGVAQSSLKKVVPRAAVVAAGAEAALLKTCVRNHTGKDRSGRVSRPAPCSRERFALRASLAFRTGSPCGVCW